MRMCVLLAMVGILAFSGCVGSESGESAKTQTGTPNHKPMDAGMEDAANKILQSGNLKLRHETGYSECQVMPGFWRLADYDTKKSLVLLFGLYCE